MVLTKNEKAFQIFSFIRTTFTYLGLPTFRTMFTERTSKLYVFLFDFNAVFGEIVVWSSLCRVYYGVFFEDMNREKMIESAVAFTFASQLVLRTLVLHIKRKSIDDYLTEIDKMNFISIEGKDNFLKLFESKYRNTKIVGMIIFRLQLFTSLATIFIGVFFLPLEKDLIPAASPLKNSHYLMKYFYRVMDSLAPFYTTRSTGMDLSILTFIKFHVVQQECLKQNLRNVLLRSEPNKEKAKKLREWIGNHQESLKHLDRLKAILEPFLLITYIYCLLNIVNVIFFAVVEGEMYWAQKALGVVSIFVCFVFLGWFCVVADELQEQQHGLISQFDLSEMMNEKWMKAPFLILTPRCYRKVKISAMGLFVLNSQGFKEVLSTSFSLMATFWQLRNRVLT